MNDKLEEVVDDSVYENGKYLVKDDYFVWLIETVEEQQKEIDQLKTTLESSIGNTKAWVNKFNELEKKYDKALTVISSKKIMEMQEENKRLKQELQEQQEDSHHYYKLFTEYYRKFHKVDE